MFVSPPPPAVAAAGGLSARRRIVLGSLALAVGALLVLVALGPLSFLHRFDGRVPVTATVTEKFSAQEAGIPAALLTYEIDGDKHVGALAGTFQVGQEVAVDAPANGSVYDQLYRTSSTTTKVFSHVAAYIGLGLLVWAVLLLVRGLRQRNAEIRARVLATYGAQIGLRPVVAPAPPPPPPPSALDAPYDL